MTEPLRDAAEEALDRMQTAFEAMPGNLEQTAQSLYFGIEQLEAALARSESEALHAHDVPGVGTLWWDASGNVVGGPEND